MDARDSWRNSLESSAVHIAMILGVTPKQVRDDFTKSEIGGFFNTEAFEFHRARQEVQGKMFKSHMDGLSVIVKALGNVAKTVAGAR